MQRPATGGGPLALDARAPVETFDACAGGYDGLFDMVGNPDIQEPCANVNGNVFPRNFESYNVGIRCCADGM